MILFAVCLTLKKAKGVLRVQWTHESLLYQELVWDVIQQKNDNSESVTF